MLLNNLVIANTGKTVNIRVDAALISAVDTPGNEDIDGGIHFDNAIVFPGLINSHDHLDFNLFPQLGSHVYKNYRDWGTELHINYREQINAILKVPKQLREEWGMYKNLLCGVTTVLDHGTRGSIKDQLITMYENKHDLHSVGFDKLWRLRLNNPFKRRLPVVIHAGEGTDRAAKLEIDSLLRWNLLKRKLVAIHGVAMHPDQARDFKALVWCPESNYYLLNKTAPINELKLETKILFGTDSTLTGRWNIWDHIRLAQKTQLLYDDELYHTLNSNPADIWNANTGNLAPGKDADLVIAKMKGENSMESFYATNPADLLLVMHKGNIRLVDYSLYPQFKKTVKLKNYSLIKIGDNYKYVEGDLAGLIKSIKQYWPEAPFPVEAVSKIPGHYKATG